VFVRAQENRHELGRPKWGLTVVVRVRALRLRNQRISNGERKPTRVRDPGQFLDDSRAPAMGGQATQTPADPFSAKPS
jgi:hypothetical protein